MLGLCLLGGLSAARGDRADAAAPGEPNVVVVMTDDQNVSDMRVMPRVEALIGDQGTTFSNSFVNDPLCCPSRSTFLTGQYAHNHGVVAGNGFRSLDSSNTLPVWLQKAGYHTGHVGKYVNGYGRRNAGGPRFVPPGWSEWYANVPGFNDQEVYDYDLNENGALVHYGHAPQDFKGDVLTTKAVSFIGRNAASADPFFLFVGYTAPHSTAPLEGASLANCDNAARPAPRHTGAFANEPLPEAPSLNEADVADKPTDISGLPPLGSYELSELTRQYRCRLGSLLHVDEGVAQIVEALRQSGELDRTLLIFVSDNGMLLGEHRIPGSKIYPYEESIRVPLLIRGPGVPVGQTVGSPAVNADLAPTILDAAGAQPGLTVDGISLFDLIATPGPKRDLLVESYVDDAAHTPYAGLRTTRYLYTEYSTGDRELYDLEADSHELDNRVSDPGYAPPLAWLAARLAELRHCQGASCQGSAGEPPVPVDRSAPQTKLDKHPRKRVKTGKKAPRARFAFSANEPSKFHCRLDKHRWRRCTSPKRVRVGKRLHLFRVVATDLSGNRDPDPARWRWRLKLRR